MHGEEISTKKWPFFPAMIQDHRDHGHDLHDHFEFAEIAGFDRESFACRNAPEPAHQELATDDDHRDPSRYQAGIELHKGNVRGSNQHLIGEGVEQDTHRRDLAALASQVTVNAVGDGRPNEERRGQQLLFAMRTAQVSCRKNPNQEGDAEYADERNGVGQVHRATIAVCRQSQKQREMIILHAVTGMQWNRRTERRRPFPRKTGR